MSIYDESEKPIGVSKVFSSVKYDSRNLFVIQIINQLTKQ